MQNIKLEQSVYGFDKKELLPAGTVLSEDFLKKLISANKTKNKKNNLLEFNTIKEDIIEFFNQENYREIFADQNILKMILGIMEKVCLPQPVLESIYYFKEYDYYTYRHILMVFALSTLLAKDLLKDTPNFIHEVFASPTHDIGKISIPPSILKKKTPLTAIEQKILQNHTLTGYVLLCYYNKDINDLAARIARDHHERKDGSGYPSKIRINDMLIEIVMVTDIYDALISPRSYRPTSYNKRTALEEITQMAARGKISMDIVKSLINYNRRNKQHINKMTISSEKRGLPPADNLYGIIINNDQDPDKT